MVEPIIGKEFPVKVVPLINESRYSIRIVVFDWRWYPSQPGNPVQLFNQAIVGAVRRGVKVQAITNIEDVVRVLKSVGVDAKKLITKNLVHVKLMIIDDALVVVGSHNYTQSAFTANMEVSVILDSPVPQVRFIDFFNHLWTAYG
jgi:phosphatidylserine/phosphatidylglycerophosphate/cardiolipin synthase-like enzyme